MIITGIVSGIEVRDFTLARMWLAIVGLYLK
jgi:hypothetical protein